jgi:ABC-type uncharacterized transport system substrate-binding protein
MRISISEKARLHLAALFACLIPCLMIGTPASAHPHVWLDLKADYVIDADHKLSAITITWTFDEFYSAFAVSDFKKLPDGTYSQKDLDSLLKENLKNLKDPEWNYFAEVKQKGKQMAFKDAIPGASTYDPKLGQLTSTFTLPLRTPLVPSEKAPVQIRIFDPTYYIDIEYVKDAPIHLTGDGHEGCTYSTKIPNAELVWTQLPKNAFTGGDGSAGQGFGSYFATTVTLMCPATGSGS